MLTGEVCRQDVRKGMILFLFLSFLALSSFFCTEPILSYKLIIVLTSPPTGCTGVPQKESTDDCKATVNPRL